MQIKLETIGIIVANMEKTLNFYRTLGFDIPASTNEDFNVDYTMPNGMVLGFLTQEAATHGDPAFVKPVGQSMNLQFLVEKPEDVDAVYTKLVNAGYRSYAEPWDAEWGQRFARITDPDGRIVNIYAHL